MPIARSYPSRYRSATLALMITGTEIIRARVAYARSWHWENRGHTTVLMLMGSSRPGSRSSRPAAPGWKQSLVNVHFWLEACLHCQRVECKGNVEVIAAQEGSYHCSVRFQLAGICLPRRDTSYHGRLKAVPSMLGAKALR